MGCTIEVQLSSTTMKLLIGLALLSFALSCRAATQIVGGTNAPEGKYPYQVSLRYNSSHFCGGSILDNRWILTTAHCAYSFREKPTSITVVAGTTLLKGGMEQSYQSEVIIYNQEYNTTNYQNDIAVIRVSKDIQFNDNVKPIGLTKQNPYPEGYPVTLTGWGSTRAGGPSPNNLQQISLRILNLGKCKRTYENISNTTQVCTLTRSGQGACQGDSGGPLVADGVQVGVVSYGIPCAQGFPDVYASVYFYTDWIRMYVPDAN